MEMNGPKETIQDFIQKPKNYWIQLKKKDQILWILGLNEARKTDKMNIQQNPQTQNLLDKKKDITEIMVTKDNILDGDVFR